MYCKICTGTVSHVLCGDVCYAVLVWEGLLYFLSLFNTVHEVGERQQGVLTVRDYMPSQVFASQV